MDHLDIAAFAAFLVAASGAGSISKTAGKRPGGLAGDLCQLVADRLRGDASAEKALAEALAKPDSKIKQTALQAAIAGKMEEDADFAEEIQRLVETIEKEGAGSSTFDQRGQKVDGAQINIAEGVKGAVFSGQFNCPLSTRGDAIDIRGSKGAVIKPGGSVSQDFGDVNHIPIITKSFNFSDSLLISSPMVNI